MFNAIERLGFAGLGSMGAGIAQRLADAGHSVTVWNRTRSKAEELNFPIADSPGDLAANVDVLFTMLTNTAAIDAVAEEILPVLRPGTAWAERFTAQRK